MKSALLIIDVQDALLQGAFEEEIVVNRINVLAASARKANVPVIFIQHERPDTAVERNSLGWKLYEGLDVQEQDIVVAKKTPDSFLNTELSDILEKYDVHRLVICGYASEFCVDTSVRRAAALNYEVILAGDAHTTHDKAHFSAKQIREHENATLPDITSFNGAISVLGTACVTFD